MAGVEQNRYKTNNGCIKHLPQTGILISEIDLTLIILISGIYLILIILISKIHIFDSNNINDSNNISEIYLILIILISGI